MCSSDKSAAKLCKLYYENQACPECVTEGFNGNARRTRRKAIYTVRSKSDQECVELQISAVQ